MTGVPPTWVKRIPCHRTRLQTSISRRAWLAVLPAGLVLAAVPLFVIQVTHSALTLQDPAGLFCILIAAAGLLRLLLA